jgi:hypothetical protein
MRKCSLPDWVGSWWSLIDHSVSVDATKTVYGRDGAARIFIKSTTSRAASATSVFTTR